MQRTIPCLRERIEVRPHIWQEAGKFLCARKEFKHPERRVMGEGLTALDAWVSWKIKDQRRTRIPRAGVQNKRDTMRWFKEGAYWCSHYVHHRGQALHFFGYDPTTDEIILRG